MSHDVEEPASARTSWLTRDIKGTLLCVVAAGFAIAGLRDLNAGQFDALFGYFKLLFVSMPLALAGAGLVYSGIRRMEPNDRTRRFGMEAFGALIAIAILWLVI